MSSSTDKPQQVDAVPRQDANGHAGHAGHGFDSDQGDRLRKRPLQVAVNDSYADTKHLNGTESKTLDGASSLSDSTVDQQPQTQRQRKARKAPHELLTDAEKKANHIASEQKRRQNIRLGFEQLVEVVPSLSQGNKSEALILQKSVEHIRNLISTKNELKAQVRDLQSLLGEPMFEEDSSEDELAYSGLS